MIVDLIQAHALAYPKRVAIICSGRRWTYSELCDHLDEVVRALKDRGGIEGHVIGVCLRPSFDLVVSLLAILKLEGCFLCLDPAHPAKRRVTLLKDAGTPLIITDDHSFLESDPIFSRSLDVLDPVTNSTTLGGRSGWKLGALKSGACSVYYTSGSTGAPKGVVGTQETILNRFEWFDRNFPFSPEDVAYLRASTNAVMSGWEIFSPLLAGIALFIPDGEGGADIGAMMNDVEKHSVTHFSLVPSLAQALLKSPKTKSNKYRSVKVLEIGADHSPPGLIRSLRKVFPSATIVHRYGSTEFPAVICNPVPPEETPQENITVGSPIDNVAAYILDERLVPVSRGEKGTLYLCGRGMSLGYLNNPSLTAEKFIACPFENGPGDKMYCTGDMARYTDVGEIEVLGRRDLTMKLSGYRIEPREIELQLLAFPGVVDAAVVKVKDDLDCEHLVGYVVPGLREPLGVIGDNMALRQHLISHLPIYMVPKVIVSLPELPLLPNRKVDRVALASIALAGTTDISDAATESTFDRLHEIWCHVLGIDTASSNKNFFDLGGDSLSAMRIIARIQDDFGVVISVNLIFEYPEFREFAQMTSALLPAGANDHTSSDSRRDDRGLS